MYSQPRSRSQAASTQSGPMAAPLESPSLQSSLSPKNFIGTAPQQLSPSQPFTCVPVVVCICCVVWKYASIYYVYTIMMIRIILYYYYIEQSTIQYLRTLFTIHETALACAESAVVTRPPGKYYCVPKICYVFPSAPPPPGFRQTRSQRPVCCVFQHCTLARPLCHHHRKIFIKPSEGRSRADELIIPRFRNNDSLWRSHSSNHCKMRRRRSRLMHRHTERHRQPPCTKL
jgi:hypothetical protein